MGQEILSSLSFLKVFLIATIFYQLNVGGYKNMCKAAPIGESSKEVKYNMNPTRDFIHVGKNDAESKEVADKTRNTKSTGYNTSQLFLYNLIMSDLESDKKEMVIYKPLYHKLCLEYEDKYDLFVKVDGI